MALLWLSGFTQNMGPFHIIIVSYFVFKKKKKKNVRLNNMLMKRTCFSKLFVKFLKLLVAKMYCFQKK